MATALDMIKRSMRLIGALGQSEDPTAQEATDALNSLNSMLDSWSLERLMIYQVKQENFTWTGGQSSRTIGSGGNFSTTRPNKIEDGFVRISNIDYPYRVVNHDVYDAIPDKTTQSEYPEIIYYKQASPLGTLYAWPVPSDSVSIYINHWVPLQSFSALTTSIALPAGYQRAIEYNHAVELHGEYPELDLPASVVQIARESKAAIKRTNPVSMIAQIEIMTGGRSDIHAG